MKPFPFAAIINTCVMLVLLSFSSVLSAQDVQRSGKSTGPIVILPGTKLQDTKLSFHFPGREYKSGNGWWALICQARCELSSITLTSKPKRHPVYDGDPVPGQLITFSPTPPAGEVLLLFKPMRLKKEFKLQAGPVPTYYPGQTPRLRRSATPGTMEGQIGLPMDQMAKLVPTLLLPENTDKRHLEMDTEPTLTLELHMDGRQQMLGTFNFGIEGKMALKPADYLIWAGDLDGDSKPDFLVNLDFAGTDQALFLSSLAQEGGLVGEAGRFRYLPIDSPGC